MISIKVCWVQWFICIKFVVEFNVFQEKELFRGGYLEGGLVGWFLIFSIEGFFIWDNLFYDISFEYDEGYCYFYDGDGVGDFILLVYKVCIVGVGVVGFYIVMIFDSLKISYDIFEVNMNYVGGCCYMYCFSEELYDYYDIGVM